MFVLQPDGDRIIKEISAKLDVECGKIIQQVPQVISNVVEKMLATTAASLEVKLRAAIRANIIHEYLDEPTSSFQFVPIVSVDGIKALEENLNDELFAKRLVSIQLPTLLFSYKYCLQIVSKSHDISGD